MPASQHKLTAEGFEQVIDLTVQKAVLYQGLTVSY